MGVLSAANRKAVPSPKVGFGLPGNQALPMDGARIAGKIGKPMKAAPAAFPGGKKRKVFGRAPSV